MRCKLSDNIGVLLPLIGSLFIWYFFWAKQPDHLRYACLKRYQLQPSALAFQRGTLTLMNAIQPSRPTLQPLETRRMVPRTQRRQRRHSYRAVAGETTVKLVVNMVLSAAALTALVQLLPYHLSQQAKLREVRAEVKRTETRVNNLRTDFSRSFDSGQAKSVMQEQSYRVDPNQRQVVLQEQGAGEDN